MLKYKHLCPLQDIMQTEFEREFKRAAQIETTYPPLKSPSFQKATLEVVRETLGIESDLRFPDLDLLASETARHLKPFVDYLTRPRSIAEFQALKMGLMQAIWDHDLPVRELRGETLLVGPQEESRAWLVHWLEHLLPRFGLLTRGEVASLADHGIPPEKTWQAFETIEPKPYRPAQNKILSLEQAVEMSLTHKEWQEGRIGYVGGKYRFGVHSQQQSLLEAAKTVLGNDGLLFIGLECREAIQCRTGQPTLPDEERLRRLAARQAVDYVFLLEPPQGRPQDVNDYYRQVWRGLQPHFYLFGPADYHWREEFERRAAELGVILLWEAETKTLSSTELLGTFLG